MEGSTMPAVRTVKKPSTAKLPETWPLLTGDDFCRHTFFEGDRCCLVGHAHRVCGQPLKGTGENMPSLKPKIDTDCALVIEAIHRAIIETIGYRPKWISVFNDKPVVPKELLARVWNRAGYLLQYTEGNPEKEKIVWSFPPFTKKQPTNKTSV
jgi:hypothetical protein